jgi:DNA-binding NarL/FixJ family response regulator
MSICIIHGRRPAREVLARALSSKLSTQIDAFSYCEDALASPLDYDQFVVYNNFHKKMSGIGGVKRIRKRKPDAFIVGVTSNPNFTTKFISAGADFVLLRAGNEVAELVDIMRQRAESSLWVGNKAASQAEHDQAQY